MTYVDPIGSLDALKLRKVLTSEKLTDSQKAYFLRKNAVEIKKIIKSQISKSEFKAMMDDRPLIRFRPLKNSFTKQGDDILLAKSLGISKQNIKKYINSVIDNNFEIKNAQDLENIEKTKTYVYRHGTKAQVIAFLEYELSDVKTTLQKLYKTLADNSGGMCDYFARPIHRMDNVTLSKLYNVIDKSLRNSANAGFIGNKQLKSVSEWALIRIYQIQNNSKVIRAYQEYKALT